MRKQIHAIRNWRVSTVARSVIFLVLFLMMVAWYGCTDVTSPTIILISIDDLRADHLGCYGYSRNTSPTIDSFAKSNILFTHCYIHQPWTLPSHISMLTSLYPITHGVDMRHSLDSAIVTLAEILKNEDYITMGFASGGAWTDGKYGFSRGFKIYYSGKPKESAADKSTLIRKHLETHKEEKLFLFIHYFDVHSDDGNKPYDAPGPFSNLFSQPYTGGYRKRFDGTSASSDFSYLNKNQIALERSELDYIISLYDNGIAYMDSCIDDLFCMLQEMDLFDDSLIIITADHGEEFQEHGYMLHENPYYYEGIVRVPLIIKLPKAARSLESSRKGKIVNGLVESIDIMPTILDIVNIQGPRMQGKSLMGLINGDGKGKEFVFGFGSNGNLMIRTERWKLLNDSGLQEGRFKLFDLHDDPMERINRSGEGLAIEVQLKEKLKEKMELSRKLKKEITGKDVVSQDSEKDDGTVSLTQEEKERLKALGYVQ